MEDFTEMLKKEMDSLDDVSSEQGQTLRRILGIEGLEGKDLLKYKIDFLAKHMGHSDLHCIEKSDYFQELIKGCIDMKKAQEFFNLAKITCIEENSSMRILCVLTDKKDNSKTIYSISDGEEIMQVSVDELKQQFKSGMKTLSKTREVEFKELLFGGTEKQEYYRHSPISDIESIMVNGLNPDLAEADLREETKIFTQEEIGKATVNVPTTQKDKSKREIQMDERKLSELQNAKQQE